MLTLLATTAALAGGGPLDVMVLYNADVPEAEDVALHYAEARSLPAGHLCPIVGVDPLATQITFDDYDRLVRAPLEDCLADLPDPDGIDYLVVVRSLPYLVALPTYVASLSAVLAVGRSTDSSGLEIAGQGQPDVGGYYAAWVPNPEYVDGFCTDLTISNPYASWYTGACGLAAADELPRSFERANAGSTAGFDFAGELFVVTRLDGFDHDDAHDLIDRAIAADGTFPTAELLCMAAADEARGARDPECEYVSRLLAADGENGAWLDTHDPALAGRTLAAMLTGTTSLQGAIDGNTWVPGAFACNLTSYGAVPENFACADEVCPAAEVQTSIARFVRAGATGAHGTAAEPLNNPFPNAGALLLYTSGYNLGESLFFSQRYLYWQSIVLGDPLTTPYAARPTLAVPATVVEGQPLVVTAEHPDGVGEVALYIDGALVAESTGEVLEVALPAIAGDVVSVLAVARAAVATRPRTGWPVAEQKVRARVQGWATAEVTIVAAEPEPHAEPGAVTPEAKGCGCATGPRPLPAWALLLVVALAWRARTGARVDGVPAAPPTGDVNSFGPPLTEEGRTGRPACSIPSWGGRMARLAAGRRPRSG